MTWKAEALPTSVITGVSASMSAATPGRSSAATPLRRVMPKAQTLACFRFESANALEVLEVLFVGGRDSPLRRKSNPRLSSRSVSRSLSASEKLMPSPWAPSRSVVS